MGVALDLVETIVLLCWLYITTHKIVSEMNCNVSSGTLNLGMSEFCAKKIANYALRFCKFCATFQPVFSMVQLSVTPVYYPEYCGLLVHLS